jgi:hypothetical protein
VEDGETGHVRNTAQQDVKHSAADLLGTLEATKFWSGNDQMGINSYAQSKMSLMLALLHTQLNFTL